MSWWPSILTSVLVVIIGLFSLATGTDNWQAWTAETARRLQVQREPLAMADAEIFTQSGQTLQLSAIDAPLLVMEFIYTRCPTVCVAMGAEFRQLQHDLISAGLQDHVQLLSLSFDLQDKPAELKHYLGRFSADTRFWWAAGFSQQAELEVLMQQIGVIAIPEPQIGYVHNAAIYLVKDHRVIAILDYADKVGLRNMIKQQLIDYRVSAI